MIKYILQLFAIGFLIYSGYSYGKDHDLAIYLALMCLVILFGTKGD